MVKLLQEHYFRQSLAEAGIVAKNIVINHRTGVCENNNVVSHGPVFPMTMLKLLQGNTIPESKRPVSYCFVGTITPKKQWVFNFKTLAHAHIRASDRGRDPRTKFSLDMDYYTLLKKSKFALAPVDVYPWSYRLFEAIMCGCIPIVRHHDKFAHQFHVYRADMIDTHIYRPKWALENFQTLVRIHTIHSKIDKALPAMWNTERSQRNEVQKLFGPKQQKPLSNILGGKPR